MKLTRKPVRKSIETLIVEPLEARIAPATISIVPKSTFTKLRSFHYAKTIALGRTATSALEFVSGAMTDA